VGYSYTPKLTKNQTERQSVSYSIRNAFDLKYMSDTTEVKKNNVITWNLSGSWNPQLPKGTRFSNISSSIRTGLGRFISLRISQTYDPYKKRVISTSMNAGFSLRLNGTFAYPGSWEVQEAETIMAAEDEATPPTDYSPTGEESGRLPWNFNVDYTVSRTSGLGRDPSTNSQLNLSGQVNITTNWKVSYSSYYDIQARKFTSYQYALTRDLHCWRASFIHRQFGDDWSYYFQIQIKSHPDIMYERGPRELFGFSQF
jgi:hypothetical protein